MDMFYERAGMIMSIKRSAAALFLASTVMIQSSVSAFAADGSVFDAENGRAVHVSEVLSDDIAKNIAKAVETKFVEQDPELVKLSQYVCEGDVLPCSENDPSYHKYIESLMNKQKAWKNCASATSFASGSLLTAALYNSANLIHQERFNDCVKTFGIDVSYFQGNIDWNKVKAGGVTFAIIRVGYRGYGSAGTLVQDARFSEYIQGAKKAGLKVGVYFFTQAINTAEAAAEADFVYERIKNYRLELPVYFDMEEITYDTGRLDSAKLSVAQKTALVEAFCDRITSKGYQGALYSNPAWLTYYLDGAKLQQKYPTWLANYTMQTKWSGPFDIWQYGGGPVNGVSSSVCDLDVRYQKLPSAVSGMKFEKGSSEDAVKLTWDPVEGCAGYELCARQSDDEIEIIKTLGTNIVEFEPDPVKHEYFVRAFVKVNNAPVYAEPVVGKGGGEGDHLPALVCTSVGDADGDGKKTADDAVIAARYAADSNSCKDRYDPTLLDVNGDGKVSTDDAVIIARCAAGYDGYSEKYSKKIIFLK